MAKAGTENGSSNNRKSTSPNSKLEAGGESSTSALIICRNKHWRYISSFHGPWLQLPPEVLESLAFNNFVLPRPHPIDPAVFFDLVKIRRLVEESTDLAVRAANGTTSSMLSNAINASNGLLGRDDAAAVGLALGLGGPNAKLSRERKHRMRELATKKLSQAYAQDEIVASVATMQSASSLEEVAKLVLQRNAENSDAKYVHFFHEKIPSRMLAQCTSLKLLDEIIRDQPNHTAALRTRAVTKVFQDDLMGAVRDLTDALSRQRHNLPQYHAERSGREPTRAFGVLNHSLNDAGLRCNPMQDQVEQPSSSMPQLLFHRAGVYLTIACRNIKLALKENCTTLGKFPIQDDTQSIESVSEQDSYRQQLDAGRLVKTYAKRALRDYLNYLSNFDYTPGLPYASIEQSARKVNAVAGSVTQPTKTFSDKLPEMSGNTSLSHGSLSDALNLRKAGDRSTLNRQSTYVPASFPPPSPQVYQVSSLFSSSSPADLLPYPNNTTAPLLQTQAAASGDRKALHAKGHRSGGQEAVTYHPLLIEALHSLLLCHSLMQTSAKELLRHAHMVSRLVRICDGYPIFLAARSPSRVDWIEIIRRAKNWICLQQSWETLCAPVALQDHKGPAKKESEEQAKERIRHESIMESLADERVYDEASFQATIKVRNKRAEEQERHPQIEGGSQRWAQSGGRDYPIGTERAELIARWVITTGAK